MLFPHIFLAFIYWVPLVKSITFHVSTPSQCDPLTVTWSDGSPPFRFLILQPDEIVQNISIPSTASQGSFNTTLDLVPTQPSQSVLFGMSDSSGILSGGISALMEVGSSVTGNDCTNPPSDLDFVFSFESPSVVQCKPFSFINYTDARLPISVVVLVPFGQSFTLHAPASDTFNWAAVNLTANTKVSFLVYDALGRNGGISKLLVVEDSDDASCISEPAVIPPTSMSDFTQPAITSASILSATTISASIPSSAIPSTAIPSTAIPSAAIPPISISSASMSSSTAPEIGPSITPGKVTSHNSHFAIIVGTAVGGLATLILLGLLVFYFRHKYNTSQYAIVTPFRTTDPINESTVVHALKSAGHLFPAHVAERLPAYTTQLGNAHHKGSWNAT